MINVDGPSLPRSGTTTRTCQVHGSHTTAFAIFYWHVASIYNTLSCLPFKFLPLILLLKIRFLDGSLRHIPSYACIQVSRLWARPVGTEPRQATSCSC